MNEQGELLRLMIENQAKKHEAFNYEITNREFSDPKQVKVAEDEIAFITMISVDASSDFKLSYNSADQAGEIERTIIAPGIVQSNILTKHHSNIKFEIDSGDPFWVSVVTVKFIK